MCRCGRALGYSQIERVSRVSETIYRIYILPWCCMWNIWKHRQLLLLLYIWTVWLNGDLLSFHSQWRNTVYSDQDIKSLFTDSLPICLSVVQSITFVCNWFASLQSNDDADVVDDDDDDADADNVDRLQFKHIGL